MMCSHDVQPNSSGETSPDCSPRSSLHRSSASETSFLLNHPSWQLFLMLRQMSKTVSEINTLRDARKY
jgi:hypothetical protein